MTKRRHTDRGNDDDGGDVPPPPGVVGSGGIVCLGTSDTVKVMGGGSGCDDCGG